MYNMEYHIQRAELCKREISKCRPFEGEMLDEIRGFYRISTTGESGLIISLRCTVYFTRK